MSAAGRTTKPGAADAPGVALGYAPPPGDSGNGRIWITAGGRHRVHCANDARRTRLLAAVLDLKLDRDARLVLLGAEVGALGRAERNALRARVGFLPAAGGLISHLNAWENIVLPLGVHHPERLQGSAARVHALLGEFGADPRALLAKLPEEMTLYEKKAAACVRMLLEAPELVLADDLAGGLDAAGRARAEGFAEAYLAACPGGTFVQLDSAAEG